MSRRGRARLGTERQGKGSNGAWGQRLKHRIDSDRHGQARRVELRQGWSRLALAGHGTFRHGEASLG